MHLKKASFILLFSAFLIDITASIQMIAYKKIKNTAVTSNSTLILKLSDPFPVRDWTQCPLECNRLTNCLAVTLNETNHCMR